MSEIVAPDVLDPVYHQRLIADMAHVCATANVSEAVVRQSAKPYLNKVELEWVTSFPEYRSKGIGLVITGLHSIAPETKIMAICGALLRNFIDARVMSLNSVIKSAEAGSPPDPTVLLIPNLYAATKTAALPSWKMQILYDVLLRRRAMSRPTVAYIENLEEFGTEHGALMAQHFTDHYKVSK